MAKKTYIAETALILQDKDGKEFRVEAGEVVDLTPEQYQDVAAHVVAAEISDEDLAEAGYQPDGETPLEDTPAESVPSETTEADAQPESKPARSRVKKGA
ncbi:hypothetical protein [Neisseria yangbaofengii]|uniref:hypothetical protein n=1 Tax=Neisseria yangbaofengii TaxID=2709396 RepID=UPI0013EBB366|nr:hypothetical protein [Neisseria yangbaofengii]